MPIQAIEPRRLYRQIAEQQRALIGRGEYPVGSRLPPERDLATQSGVSRPSVRDASIALEVQGQYETIRARQPIECELAAAAATMNAAQVAGLREALSLMADDIGRSPRHARPPATLARPPCRPLCRPLCQQLAAVA